MMGAILDLMFLALLAGWAAGVGSRLARRLGGEITYHADLLALAVPIGLGTLALALLGLGQVGWMTRGGMLGVFVLGGVVAAWPGRSLRRADTAAGVSTESRDRYEVGFDRVVIFALGCTVIGSLLTALGPVTDGDALCYHLQVPKVFLASGAVGYEPDLHETVYPLVTELLYGAALAWRGPVACRLVQWLLGLVFAANVAALARPVLGAKARWAAAFALLAPAVSNGMAAPLNDVALAAFAAAALHARQRWRDSSTIGPAVLAGLLAGMTLGVKYPALVWVGLLGLSMLGRRTWRHALVFGATAAVVGLPWYGRAYLYTGNPVHPFFREVFGSGLAEVLDPATLPLHVTVPNLLAAPALLTLQPERFDSFAHQLGPVFLMLLPGLLVLRPPRRVAGLVALGWLFLTICLTKRQSTRFVLGVVGPWSVGAAWVAAGVLRGRSGAGRFVAAMVSVVLLFEAAISLGHARHGIGVVLGRESAASYLARREPTFVVGRWIDANLPASARLIGQDHRGFYLPRPYTMELAHRRRTGLAGRGESAAAVVDRLRSAGYTHLLLCPPEPPDAVEFDPTLGRVLAPWLAGRTPLYERELADADGVLRRYAIHELTGPAPVRAAWLAGRERGGPP